MFIENHRKRRRVLKNNERLAHAKAASVSPPEDVQDQGFTRPSVLVLLPFRSSALAWLDALTAHTPSPAYQIENHSRFLSEYALPSDAVDKLAVAEPGTYPRDHVETFKGNVDDNFRVGIKLTRKSVKLFADFYGCDIIFASPLGLRMSIEKEKCVYCANPSQRSTVTSPQKRRFFIIDRDIGDRPNERTGNAKLGACPGVPMSYFLLIHFLIMCMSVCPLKHEQPAERFP
jgi:hypothetical protein